MALHVPISDLENNPSSTNYFLNYLKEEITTLMTSDQVRQCPVEDPVEVWDLCTQTAPAAMSLNQSRSLKARWKRTNLIAERKAAVAIGGGGGG